MKLVTVELRTQLGAVYVFPDMPDEEMRKMLEAIGNTSMSQLTLVNVSQAVLCTPLRILATILVDGEERWTCSPACTAKSP